MPDPTIPANTLKPSNKVTAGAFAASVTTVIVWSVHEFAGIEIPAEVAVAGLGIITFVVQYFTRDSE